MADYYISTTGNDTTGDGTLASPWATFAKVYGLGSAASGKVCEVRGGSYTASRSNDNVRTGYLEFKPYTGETVTLTACVLTNVQWVRLRGFAIPTTTSLGTTGTNTGVQDVQLIGCTVTGNGIQIYGDGNNVLVEDCVVDGGAIYPTVSGNINLIVVGRTNTEQYPTNTILRRSVFRNTIADAIWVRRSDTTLVDGCEVYGNYQPPGTGNTYHPDIVGQQYRADNLTIRNCYFHDNPSSEILIGSDMKLSFDAGYAVGFTFENNVVVNNNSATPQFRTIQLFDYPNMVIRNNTVWGNGGDGFLIRSDGPDVTGIVFENNITETLGTSNDGVLSPLPAYTYASKTNNLCPVNIGIGNIVGSPVFEGAGTVKADFRPAAGSLALNAATATFPSTDTDGRPRPVGVAADIGAYERQTADDPPPPDPVGTTEGSGCHAPATAP